LHRYLIVVEQTPVTGLMITVNLINTCIDKCPAGQFSATGYQPCVRCPRGSFQTGHGSTLCENCPDQQSTAETGSRRPSACRGRPTVFVWVIFLLILFTRLNSLHNTRFLRVRENWKLIMEFD